MNNKKTSFTYTIALSLTLLLWASAFPGIRVGLKSYSPTNLAFLRFLVASLILLIRAVLFGIKLPEKADIPAIMLLGFLGIAVYHTALNFGEVTVSSGVASIVVNSAPVFTAILATTILRERLSIWGWLGSGISFAGVILLSLGKDKGIGLAPGALLVLLAALSYSCYVILQKPLLRKYSALELTSYAIWTGTIFLLVFAPSAVKNVQVAEWSATLSVLYLGIFPAAIAYVCWAYVLSKCEASQASTFLYLEPVLSFTIAWLWLGEVPTVMSIFGGIICLVGVLIVGMSGRLGHSRATQLS